MTNKHHTNQTAEQENSKPTIKRKNETMNEANGCIKLTRD